MAAVHFFIKIEGDDAEGACSFTKALLSPIVCSLKHQGNKVVVKIALVCPRCGKLVNPDQGSLCGSCAGDEAIDRQAQSIQEGLQLTPAPALQLAEAPF